MVSLSSRNLSTSNGEGVYGSKSFLGQKAHVADKVFGKKPESAIKENGISGDEKVNEGVKSDFDTMFEP